MLVVKRSCSYSIHTLKKRTAIYNLLKKRPRETVLGPQTFPLQAGKGSWTRDYKGNKFNEFIIVFLANCASWFAEVDLLIIDN